MLKKGYNKILFNFKKTIEWGHIDGMIRGLPVQIGSFHVVWGLKTTQV